MNKTSKKVNIKFKIDNNMGEQLKAKQKYTTEYLQSLKDYRKGYTTHKCNCPYCDSNKKTKK